MCAVYDHLKHTMHNSPIDGIAITFVNGETVGSIWDHHAVYSVSCFCYSVNTTYHLQYYMIKLLIFLSDFYTCIITITNLLPY